MARNLLLISLVLCSITYATSLECTTTDGKDSDGKSFPDIFDGTALSYEVTVEFNNYVNKETIFFKEYYDISSSNGRTEIWRKDDYKDFRYFKDSNEAFTYSQWKCESVQLDEVAPPFLEDSVKNWEYRDYKDNKIVRYIYGPTALFKSAYERYQKTENRIVYMGNVDTVRSIPAEQWKECDDDDNEIHYYFANLSWKTPSGNIYTGKMPLRVTLVGKENEIEYNQTTEFINFKPFVSNQDEVFRILEGRGCDRQVKNELLVPKFLDIDHVARAEIVYYPIESKNVYSHYVSSIQLAYHKISGLVMYRFAPWKTGSGTKDKQAELDSLETIVWDNKNNVVFTINEETGDCEISRDSDYYPAFPLPDEGDIDLLHPEILLKNDDFQFIGRTTIRKIKALIFEKQIKDMYFGRKYVPLTIITRYYSEDDTVIGTETDNNPIRINIALYNDTDKKQVDDIIVINIYSFITELQRAWALFDVSKCFKNYDQYQWFTATFSIPSGVDIESLRSKSKDIEEEFLGSLYTKTDLTPARISRVLVDITFDVFNVEVLVVDRPPAMLEFSTEFKEEEISKYDYADTALNLLECTQKCVDYASEKACQTVSYCGNSCYISKTENAKGTPNKGCLTFYRKAIMTAIPTLESLLKDIKDIVQEDLVLSLEVVSGDTEVRLNFPAISYYDTDHVGEEDKILRERDFVRKMVGYKIVPDEDTKVKHYGKQSLSYCRRICRNNAKCETISYCFASNECVTSNEYRVDISINSIKKDTQCVILGRDYISEYQKHVGTVLTRKAEVILSENTEDDCARMCSNNKDRCKSFDMCLDATTKKYSCFLHSAHIFDLKEKDQTKAAASCSHYSRKYIKEFTQIPNKRIKSDGDLVLKDLDADECAKQCVETAGFVCQGFDYCEATEEIDNRCILSGSGSDAETITKTNCNRYYRSNLQVSDNKSSLYSNGLAAGLGILFFVIGCIAGIGATFAFGYYRANRR